MASTPELLERIQSLYDDGQCLAAWHMGKTLGNVRDWPGLEGRQMAARLAYYLGAPRLSSLLHLKNFRDHRDNPRTQYFYLFSVQERYGALRAWMERRSFGPPADRDDLQSVADYHGQCAQLLGALRDFERAEEHLAFSKLADGSRPYWFSERAQLFELEDRVGDALQTARDGLAASPRYPPLIMAAAHYLQLLEKLDEALELLRWATNEVESSGVVALLIRLLIKRRLYDDVPRAIERLEALTPLREKLFDKWLISVRAEVAARHGDYAVAMEYADKLEEPQFKDMAESIRAYLARHPGGPNVPPRHELQVPFVRQHHLTCAPATLSAISRFWDRSADHLAIAEAICYDGTPAYSERRWASTNGWKTLEFRVDWESTRALIDRGIPFTLQLSDTATGHLQAVIGYDEPTGMLLVRDPMMHETMELNARDLLSGQASTGPRGLALVPTDQSPLLDGLRLPDGELYDLYHRMQLALEDHRRGEAAECYQLMLATEPQHRLTMIARRALAGYDNNRLEALAATDALIAVFPDDQRLQLDRLSTMRPVSNRAERLAWLESACARPKADALLWLEFAKELMADDRLLSDAHALLRRALRRRPDDASVIHELAELHWRLGRREDALELYRIAACAAGYSEEFALSYFHASRWMKRTDAGLAFLRARVERTGARSSAPATSLFVALEALNSIDDAFAELDEAVARRPDDGELRLFAARRYALYRRPEHAEAHIAAARGLVKPSAWLAESAYEAQFHGDRERALEGWQAVLNVEPLNLEAHRMTALLLSETSTRAEAIAHLRAYCERFPHNAALYILLYEWTETEPAAEREGVLRHLLEVEPAHAWAMRELSVNLSQQSRFLEALLRADEAIALEAGHSAGHGVKAHVLQAMGRAPEAAESYRAAIRLWADNSDTMFGLLDTCGETVDEHKHALEFIRSQLESQAVIGDGVLAFRSVARGVLTREELLEALRRLHGHRPDLWQAWSALVRHLGEMGAGHTNEALSLARQAAERFSKVPAVWYELAQTYRAQVTGDAEAEITSIERCLELNPEWLTAVQYLSEAFERGHRAADAERLLTSAIQRTPLAPALRTGLARLVHKRGDVDHAVEIVREAIRVYPDYDESWLLLADWSRARDQGRGMDELLTFARAFAESRPTEARAWMRLADIELRTDRAEQALGTIERVIEMQPRNAEAYDFKAMVLTRLRRFREAEQACDPVALRGRDSFMLQGRAAWVDAQRGDLAAAIERLRKLVGRVPDRPWAWAQLTEWYGMQGKMKETAAAAERWAWLEAGNAVPLGWLGEAKSKQGDRAGAKEVFQRAMRLQPQYLFAGFAFFAIQLAERDFDGAARTLEILSANASTEQILASRVQLAVVKDDKDGALALVRELCVNPDYESQAIKRAVESIPVHQWQDELERTVREALDEPVWNAATPAAWARIRVRRGRLGSRSWYRRLATLGEPGKHAICEFLEAVGNRAKLRPPLPLRLDWHVELIRHYCKAWRGDDEYWGKMSYALVCRNRTRSLVKWMDDWRERPKAEAWMLQNLTISLLARRRDEEARAVMRHVAALSLGLDIGVTMRLWCAIGACLDADTALADRLLHETPHGGLAPHEASLRRFADSFVSVVRSPPASGTVEDGTWRALDEAVGGAAGQPTSSRLLALARRGIAQRVNSPWQKLVAWKYLHPRLFHWGMLAAIVVALRILSVVFGGT